MNQLIDVGKERVDFSKTKSELAKFNPHIFGGTLHTACGLPSPIVFKLLAFPREKSSSREMHSSIGARELTPSAVRRSFVACDRCPPNLLPSP